MHTRLLTLALLVLLFLAGPTSGHPTLNPHTHDDTTVKWEKDHAEGTGDKDGDTAHNHVADRNFGGFFQLTRQPYSAVGCWDNFNHRDDRDGDFDEGHCFINEDDDAKIVRYRINSSVPEEARPLIRDAFAAWSAIPPAPGQSMGLEFVEGAPADLNVVWESETTAGVWIAATKTLRFDNDPNRNWSWEKDPSGIADNKWHFYSVVLHEVGHVVGLDHQLDTDDLMHAGSGQATIGAPKNQGGFHWDFIDEDSIKGAQELYGHPPPPKPTVGVIPMGCDGQTCNDYEIVFGGSPYAQSYEVQRALAPNGPWFNHSISMTGDHRGLVHSTEWQTTYWRARVTLGTGNSDWSDVHNAADQCDVDDDCPFPGFCGPFY